MGIRGSSTCELIREDRIIPKDRLLGVKARASSWPWLRWTVAVWIASQALGIPRAPDRLCQGAQAVWPPIAQFQNTQFELAEMKARLTLPSIWSRSCPEEAGCHGRPEGPLSVEAAEAKLIAARTASDVTRRCLQLFGGYGYTRDYPIERMMRDAKITEIYEGTSEVQMMVIGGALL